ncbi:hypothetical protein BT96DRAFT_1080342 [Gymnopus androsaceus JB14]|uniref:Uncharacterized protein n=1 Tax=Gymnopus androsaceus JB14 TaxID=1447944 RepID=A0A6A4GQF4_9AGAR|nr:hypothetical protein BT96DRAFT_1080342 [Gymnopus androsaceus JB14]
MFAQVSIVVAILSAASGLILNVTPTNIFPGGVSSVSWTATSNDSTSVPSTVRIIASVVDPSTDSPFIIEWPEDIIPGLHTVGAVSISNLSHIYAESDQFSISSSITPTSSPTAPTLSSSTTSIAGAGSRTSSTASAPSAKTAVVAIVGGAVGGVVAFVLVGLCTFLSIRRRDRSRQEGFERGTFKDPEDGMRASPTRDGSVPLRQEALSTMMENASSPNPQVEQRANSLLLHGAFFTHPTLNPSFYPAATSEGSMPLRQEVLVTVEDANIPNPQVEQRANSPLPHRTFSTPPTPNSSFDPAVPSASDGSVPLRQDVITTEDAKILFSTYYMHDGMLDPSSPSTTRATWGEVASKADNLIPSPMTNGLEPAHLIEAICRDEEQPLDICDSRCNTITSPMPLQALNQTQESLELYNNQGQYLTMEEEVLLLELQLQIARRRLAENHGSIYPQTPPPEYASTSS